MPLETNNKFISDSNYDESTDVLRGCTVRVITINEFERVVGVRSSTLGAQHFDLAFEVIQDSGDYGTTIVGHTPESSLYDK